MVNSDLNGCHIIRNIWQPQLQEQLSVRLILQPMRQQVSHNKFMVTTIQAGKADISLIDLFQGSAIPFSVSCHTYA